MLILMVKAALTQYALNFRLTWKNNNTDICSIYKESNASSQNLPYWLDEKSNASNTVSSCKKYIDEMGTVHIQWDSSR